MPGSKSYPQPERSRLAPPLHEFEALERTFTLAAPLMHADPEITICGIKLRDYYKHHLYNALTPGHANSSRCRRICRMRPISSPASSAA
jgi:hypothetical protein